VNSSNALRKLASPVLYASRAYKRRWQRHARREPFTLVLVYHRVVPDQEPDAGRFDIERGVPVSVFEKQLRFLLKHFTPIKPSQVTEPPSEPMRFAVTLDDGYEDNFSVAAPVMRRLGVSAGFYVVSDYVGTERLFWWEKLARMMRASRMLHLDLEVTVPELMVSHSLPPMLSLRTDAHRAAAYERLTAAIRAGPHAAIPLQLEHLSQALAVPLCEEGRDYGLMSWAQLSELARQGFEIGGHTATHCNLAGATQVTLNTEVVSAVATIQRKLELPVLTFAYPYGYNQHFDESAAKAVEAAGCRAAFTAERSAVRTRHCAFALPRLIFNRTYDFAWAYNVQNALSAS
jgi:peptidoglycan/xylan/chitin deacetylase (PgdA/CDA1 family)